MISFDIIRDIIAIDDEARTTKSINIMIETILSCSCNIENIIGRNEIFTVFVFDDVKEIFKSPEMDRENKLPQKAKVEFIAK